MKSYTLTLTERQARVIEEALDVYSRLMTGQWRPAFDKLPLKDDKQLDWGNWQDFLREVGDELSRFMKQDIDGYRSSLGIYNNHVSDDARVAWDIQRVIRHRVSWDRAVDLEYVQNLDSPRNWNKMTGVNYDEPDQSGTEPLPEIRCNEATA